METISSAQVLNNWTQTLESAQAQPIIIADRGKKPVVMMDAKLGEQLIKILKERQLL